MLSLSRKFLDSLKNTGKPYHKLAWEVGLTPGQLYRITSGIDHPGREDPRIRKLCAYLGLSIDDAFDCETIGYQPQTQSNA